MSYLQNYLGRIRAAGRPALADAIADTCRRIGPAYIENFSYSEHVVSLLMGDVQSGKTSHMFGVMCTAADNNFGIFILLTTDNVILQQQTYRRAVKDLCDFCVCDEQDYVKFQANVLHKPVVIILKKNPNVLKQWKNNLSSGPYTAGNPLFIVDDEADAASLNTQVNKNKQSTINRHLETIKKLSSSSIFMQVTGTPQAILLQSRVSGWKPYFIHYFKPGAGYLGGNFFFSEPMPSQIVLTSNDEAADILDDDEFPENGLKSALVVHLITAAHLFLTGAKVCNFMIHPSMKTSDHQAFAEKIGQYLNEVSHSLDEESTITAFQSEYNKLLVTKPDLKSFEEIMLFIRQQLDEDKIGIIVLNSLTKYFDPTNMGADRKEPYEEGINIVVGGNSLGRGVTFPMLQTIYYCRVAKSPQADTMWQHARMFGYDRDPGLMRVYMPPHLFKLFSDINNTNNSIIHQILKYDGSGDLKLFYPFGLRPTRKNVLDQKRVGVYSGGVNYFPFEPNNRSIDTLDSMLSVFGDDVYSVSTGLIVNIIKQIDCDPEDWNADAFAGIINALTIDVPLSQAKLIVRRERDIAKGTGTLLSPNDRALGESMPDDVVLTMYKVTGRKGWDGRQLWIPNIKLPGNYAYYSGDANA